MRKLALMIASSLVIFNSFAEKIQSQTTDQQKKSEAVTIRSTEVLVDAVVLDRKNRLIGDLTAQDFDIYEDGVPQQLSSFRVVRGAPERHAPITDPQAVYDQTKAEYASQFGLAVSPQLGFANDFAILVRGDVARKNNLKTISDAVPISRNWQAGFGQDFMSRADGYPGFSKAYGLNFAKQPREMDLSLTYRALQSGELDIIAGNSTDGLISALDLFQLADDKHYFPPYQAVFIAQQDAIPVLTETFEKLRNAISTEEMRRLNYEVDGNKRTPKDVAAEWVKTKGF